MYITQYYLVIRKYVGQAASLSVDIWREVQQMVRQDVLYYEDAKIIPKCHYW